MREGIEYFVEEEAGKRYSLPVRVAAVVVMVLTYTFCYLYEFACSPFSVVSTWCQAAKAGAVNVVWFIAYLGSYLVDVIRGLLYRWRNCQANVGS